MEQHKNNAAGRAAAIVQRARNTNATKNRAAWKKVFRLDGRDGHAVTVRLTRCLLAVDEELDRVEAFWSETGVQSTSGIKGIQKIRSAFSPANLDGSWSKVRQTLSATTTDALTLASDLMPEDGPTVPEDEVTSLWQLVEGLREAVSDSDLPNEVKAALYRHLNAFSHALQDFEVKGPRAFHEASVTAIADGRDIGLLRRFRDHPVVQAVSGLWTWASWRSQQALPMLLVCNLISSPDRATLATLGTVPQESPEVAWEEVLGPGQVEVLQLMLPPPPMPNAEEEPEEESPEAG